MIIELEETKTWLRVDGNEENGIIQVLINAAETYLHNATGLLFDSSNAQAKMLCWVLCADWYENRQLIGRDTSDKVRFTVSSMIAQLQYAYEPPTAPTGLSATAGNAAVDLSWSSVDGAAGYHVYQDGRKITSSPVSATTYRVNGLANGTQYCFQVSAVDAPGNESILSVSVSATPMA